MNYFKLVLMWLGFIVIVPLYGEYAVSREVNGYLIPNKVIYHL
jgi:hypothetical protein